MLSRCSSKASRNTCASLVPRQRAPANARGTGRTGRRRGAHKRYDRHPYGLSLCRPAYEECVVASTLSFAVVRSRTVGVIFGTGCNAAYMETAGNVPKMKKLNLPEDAQMAINCVSLRLYLRKSDTQNDRAQANGARLTRRSSRSCRGQSTTISSMKPRTSLASRPLRST